MASKPLPFSFSILLSQFTLLGQAIISIYEKARTAMYTARELSSNTFPDFERLALKQGGCWCMYYQRAKPIANVHGEELKRINRKDKKALVQRGKSHAILVYSGETPVGWCQYGTQDELPRIDAGRGYKKIGPPKQDAKLWRITCFFVDREYRNKGVSKFALKAALKSIHDQGGGIVEAYPVVSKKMAATPEWRWFGTPSMFERQGFKQVGPLGNTWVLMRKTLVPVKSLGELRGAFKSHEKFVREGIRELGREHRKEARS